MNRQVKKHKVKNFVHITKSVKEHDDKESKLQQTTTWHSSKKSTQKLPAITVCFVLINSISLF